MNRYDHPGAQPQGGSWLPAKRPQDFVFILLLFMAMFAAFLAIALLILSVAPALLNLVSSVGLPYLNRLAADNLLIGSLSLLLLAIFLLLLARLRIKRNPRFQFINGCPSCKQRDLIRVHRLNVHRILGATLRLPLRNYACRNCAWNGGLLYYVPFELAGSVSGPPSQEPTPQLAATAIDPRELAASVDAEVQPAPHLELLDSVEVLPAPSGVPEQAEIASLPATVEPPEMAASASAVAEVDQNGDHEIPEEASNAVPDDVPDVKQEPPAAPVDTVPPEQVWEGQEDTGQEVDVVGEDEPDELASSAPVPEVEDRERESRPFPASQVWLTELTGDEAAVSNRAVVIAPFGLSMRSAPDKNAEIVMSLDADTVVEILDPGDATAPVSWHKVNHAGQVGWVSAAFLRYLYG